MSDISEFLQSYRETLCQEIMDTDMPPELTERFTFDSCVRRQDGHEVYFITGKTDGKRAVLRVNDTNGSEDAAAEEAILTRLDYPAIPKVLGFWERNGRSYLVREYFEGDDLRTYIRKQGSLSREQLLDITLNLCDILIYTHGQIPAVIHRDIKPENIIILGRNSVKLIDFGIARIFKSEIDSDKDTRVAGTRPYMAPEQFGSEQTDNRADIYALGMVMIFMATGKVDRQALKNIFPYKELIPVIEKCLKKDRDRRFKTVTQLKRKILWIQRRMTRKILMTVGVCTIAVTAFFSGMFIGQNQGFQNGVDSIMDIPTDKNRPFTQEELYQPVEFDSFYLDMAVRNVLNKTAEETIYRTDLVNRIGEITIYGTYILHPSLEVQLTKENKGKGVVTYLTSDGFWIEERGDISSLKDIPNMYYLRNLTLTSQSVADLSPLTGMKLEKIVLCDNFIGNLLPLKDMVTLKELDISMNPLKDLTPISYLLSLESLDISQTQVTDLMSLAEFTRLQTLKLEYCDVSDISILTNLTDLREVDVSNTLVTDLTPLIRPENPITVRCVGLPEEIVDKVRDNPGIVLIEK